MGNDAPSDLTLTVPEAYDLGNALCHSLAQSCEIRLLTIKGPVLQQQGLRGRYASTDIDLLVEPGRFHDFCAALVLAGWRALPGVERGDEAPDKARTYVKENWPLTIDVHRRFPGFLASVDVVFDALWSRREWQVFAGVAGASPDRVGSTLILGLHSIPALKQHRQRREFTYLITEVEFSEEDQIELVSLAQATGSVRTLRKLWDALAMQVPVGKWDVLGRDYSDWEAMITTGGAEGTRLLTRLHRVSFKRYPRVIWRSVWLHPDQIRSLDPTLDDTWRARLRFRTHRICRGLRSLPEMYRCRRIGKRARGVE